MSGKQKVPYLDLKALHAPLKAEIGQAIERVIDSAAFALGPAVAEFEDNFARYCGVEHCVGLNNGTSAVHVALICAGVQSGDEVITTPYTFIATSWAISYIGAQPVYVDVDPETYCLDASRIERVITPKTKAIVAVHLYGHPADMDAILDVARRHNLAVIEDAAQAHGALYKQKRCGSFADIASFSFYPGKNLGAFGEGGAVVTRNADWAARARNLRHHAQAQANRHDELGFNYRMDGIQAAVLNVKLKHVDRWNARRRELVEHYAAAFQGAADVVVPIAASWAQPAWHVYAIQHPARDRLRQHLGEKGIQAAVHYPLPNHLQPAYAHLGCKEGDFPIAEHLAQRELSLPICPTLSQAHVDCVVDAIRSFR